jgi:hypothetical protein
MFDTLLLRPSLLYTQTIRRATRLTTLVGRISEMRTQGGQTKINDEIAA